jgi:hypothetical protein
MGARASTAVVAIAEGLARRGIRTLSRSTYIGMLHHSPIRSMTEPFGQKIELVDFSVNSDRTVRSLIFAYLCAIL